MVALMIKNPNLPTGYEILNTSWWLSDSPDFEDINIIGISIEDEINLLNIQFDVELEIGRKYYAKCRVVYNKGFSNDSNINVFIARDLNEINLDLVPPTKISRPTISITPSTKLKPLGLLSFSGGPFVSKFEVEHWTSSWILEEVKTNKVIWSRLEDGTNLTSVSLPINLKPNSAYKITLAYRGKNNNLSQFASKTFVTGANSVKIKGDLISVPSGMDLPIEVDRSEAGVENIFYKLYANGTFLVDEYVTSISSGEDTRKYTIDGSLISPEVDYTLHIEVLEYNGVRRNGYFYFKPYFDLSETPDPNIKYENKTKEYAATYTPENFSDSTGFRPELPNNEIISIESRLGNVSLHFYKIDSTNGRFDYTGKTYRLGELKPSSIELDTSFSYILLKNSRLIIKGHNSGILISIPYNVISGELDINAIRYSFELGETASKAKLQHGLIAADNSQFLAFSIETGRLVMVNSIDLSFTFVGPKTYDTDRTMIGLYKLALDTVFILYLDMDGVYKADVYNIRTNSFVEFIEILDPTTNPENIDMLKDNTIIFKMVTLFNGQVLVVLTDTDGKNIYKKYRLDFNTLVPLIDKPLGIDSGVYSLLRNGNLLQMDETKEIIFY